MLTLTLWVLIAVNSGGTTMMAQQFQSHAACVKAQEFLESKRGTYVWAECIRDDPGSDRQSRSGQRMDPDSRSNTPLN